MAMIRELAYSLFSDSGTNIDEIREKYLYASPSQIKPKELGKHPLPEILQKHFEALSILEKLCLCREIHLTLGSTDPFIEALFGKYEPCSKDAANKIAYVKNKFTDAAYLKFAESIGTAKFSYFTSFEMACEEVYSGKCEFCILPIETSIDGKLFTFYSIIDKYELKITSLCTVAHSDDQRHTTFALLRKSLFSTNILSSVSSKIRFEIRIPQSPLGVSPLQSIIQAATACDLQLCSMNSMPLTYRDNLMSHHAVFSSNGTTELSTFLTYIALEFPQCYAVGAYYLHNKK
jgi:prephenate dehydratase